MARIYNHLVFVRNLRNYFNRNYCLQNTESGVNHEPKSANEIIAQQEWLSVIGLEIHAQICSGSKLFSKSRNSGEFNAVNTNVNEFDAGMPGTLPVLNEACVDAAIRTGLALECEIQPVSVFERKHYFYSDLPLGYQITQRKYPIAKNGCLKLTQDDRVRIVRLKQIQLEQDSGRSIHDPVNNCSLIDLNRAGVPLMELVFEPDLKSSHETVQLLKQLVRILRHLRTCSCRMEDGALRVDANVSIRRSNEPLTSGIRTEIKNISSIRGVRDAIDYEIRRQINLKAKNKPIVNETLQWSSELNRTLVMRDKETDWHDYRFYPEFDLGPVMLSNRRIAKIAADMPTLPDRLRANLRERYDLRDIHIDILLVILDDNLDLLDLFEKSVNKGKNAQLTTNFLINEALSILNENSYANYNRSDFVNNFVDLIELLEKRMVNLAIAKQTFEILVQNSCSTINKSPGQIITEMNWYLITDHDRIESLCRQAIEKEPNLVQAYRQTNKKGIIKVLLRHVFEISNRCADMKISDQIIRKLLNEKKPQT